MSSRQQKCLFCRLSPLVTPSAFALPNHCLTASKPFQSRDSSCIQTTWARPHQYACGSCTANPRKLRSPKACFSMPSLQLTIGINIWCTTFLAIIYLHSCEGLLFSLGPHVTCTTLWWTRLDFLLPLPELRSCWVMPFLSSIACKCAVKMKLVISMGQWGQG